MRIRLMPLVTNGYSTYLEQDTAVNTKHIYHRVSVAGVRKPLGNQNVPHHREQSLTQINRLTPNDTYMGRTAPLTSKRFILYIYSTNVSTQYFKHALHSPFFLFKMQFVS